MSPILKAHFTDYAAFHGTPGNRACHYVGIPLIVLSLFAMLSAVPLFTVGGFTVTLAVVLLLGATAYYLTLDPVLAVLMLAISAASIAVGQYIPVVWALALFVVGWIFQFVGHAYERKPPEFLKDWRFLFVGLRWWFKKLQGRA
jgi:uncharacterized membrane protein YGL010W